MTVTHEPEIGVTVTGARTCQHPVQATALSWPRPCGAAVPGTKRPAPCHPTDIVYLNSDGSVAWPGPDEIEGAHHRALTKSNHDACLVHWSTGRIDIVRIRSGRYAVQVAPPVGSPYPGYRVTARSWHQATVEAALLIHLRRRYDLEAVFMGVSRG